MKRAIAILFSIVYMLSAVGVSVEHFYCCGKLATTSFSLGDNQRQENLAKHSTENCCKTTKQSFKVKDNHVGTTTSSIVLTWVAVLTQPGPALPEPAVQEYYAVIYHAHGPPERQQTPIYILNCTYRI